MPARRTPPWQVLAALLACFVLPAALHAAEPAPWTPVARLVDVPYAGALDVTDAVRHGVAHVHFAFPVVLDDRRYEGVLVGPTFLQLLSAMPPDPPGDPEGDVARRAFAAARVFPLGPRIEILDGDLVRLAGEGRVLVAEAPGRMAIRWTALAARGVRGVAVVEALVEPDAITTQYLHVPEGFTDSAPSPKATAFRLAGAPADVSMPFLPVPTPSSTAPPPPGCDPNPGSWCDYTGASCTADAGGPCPGGDCTSCATRVSDIWGFYEGGFCRDCPYRFYILVECGRDMHLPFYDMEGLDLEITNMVTGDKPPLRCRNETSLGLGPSRSWSGPPSCGGAKPGPWWAPSLDVTDNAGPGHVSFSDSTPTNGTCTTRYDVPCVDLPASGAAPTVNFGEEQTIDCFIEDANGLCGIYRVDIISGGNGWDLFSNCDGTNTPQFDIFVDCTEAWAAYNPLPELAIANVSATGNCYTYDIHFEVHNIGCTDEPSDVPVRITSECGDVLDLVVPGPVPAHGIVPYTQPMTLSCPDGTITFTVDPDDDLLECTETSSAAACQAEEGVDTLDAEVVCCPLVNAGLDKQACAGQSLSLIDASSQFADVFLWTDGGAGGTFSPSATVRNPTYTAPAPGPPTITLTLQVTFSGSGCSRTDALLLTVNPSPAVTGGADKATCAGTAVALDDAAAGSADAFTWSDGGAGGTFVPSATVLNPSYRHASPGTYTLTLTGEDAATGCSGSDEVDVVVHPRPPADAGVDRQACACEPVHLADATSGGGDVFSWSDGGAGGSFLPSASVRNPTYVNENAGTVTLTLTTSVAATGCTAADSLVVELVECPDVFAGPPEDACLGDGALLAEATAGTATHYLWDDAGAGGTFSPGSSSLNPVYENPAVGTYPLTLVATERVADGTILYENDFEAPVGAEWSSGTRTTTPSGRTILGEFGNDTVTLTLTGLPTHDHLALCFDLHVLRSWDGHVAALPSVGPDTWEVVADGTTLLHATFGSAALSRPQSHPEAYDETLGAGSPSHPAGTGADEVDTLGYPAAEGGDATYRTSFTFRHSASSVTLTFRGLRLEGLADESWGLDEIVLTDGSCRACTRSESTSVTVHPLPVVDAGADKAACAGTSVPLDDADGGAATGFRWSDGGEGGTFTPSSRVLHPAYANPRPGIYTLTLTGTGAGGCEASDTLEVEVNANPLVSAGVDKSGCESEPVALDDAYASSGTTVLWSDGGAGGTFAPSATILEPTYSHTVPGTYTLTLEATRPSTGCTASDVLVVTVNARPAVSAGGDLEGCAGSPVAIAGSSSAAATLLWTDGGASGTFSPSPAVLHPSYSNVAGSYTLTLRGTEATGCSREDDLALTIHPLPTVDAGAPKEACAGTNVALADATSSADTFAWSDGGAGGVFTPSASVRNPSYRNAVAGAYTLTLTATQSSTGCPASDTVVVTVRNLPVSSFTILDDPACEDSAVCFDNTSVGGTSWSWSFGDGAGSSTQPEPCYSYSTPGTYTVRLTATNACGSDTEEHPVTIQPKPVAAFTYSTSGGKFCKNKAVAFEDGSTNAPTSWLWDFGDGSTSTLQDPSHTYTVDGVFIVSLVACNACGCSPPAYDAIEILATCLSNCEANSNQIDCDEGVPATVTGDTCADHDNFNTSSYPCAPGINYAGDNKIYDLNFDSGANFIITLTETVPEPNGYDLDLMISDNCNPPSCAAWGDTEVFYDDRTLANDDYWLIVDGRNGTCGPYEIEVRCLADGETAACEPPTFSGIVSAEDLDPCGIPGILLTWSGVTDWGTGQDGLPCPEGHFEIWRAPVSDPDDETNVGTVAGTLTTFVDTKDVPRRDYRYRVHAVNECCAEPAVTTATEDGTDDFGNAIDVDAGTGGTITCDDPEHQLLGSASGGSGAGFDYLWSPAAGLSDPAVPNPVATAGGTYTLTVTDRGDGCEASDTVVVVGDNVAPTAGAGPDRVITCATTSVTLAGTAAGGNASAGYAFSWTPAGPLDDASSPAPSTSTPGTYTLTVEAIATGCVATDVVVVTEDVAPPVANAGPNKELTCAVTVVELDGSASGGSGVGTHAFSWSPASGVDMPSSPTPHVTTPGTYTLTVTDLGNGCTDTDVVVVIANDDPPTAAAGPDRVLSCDAGPVTLNGSAFGGDGSDGYAFSWAPADAVSDALAEDPSTSVPGTYTLTVTDVHSGCADTDTVVVAPAPGAPAAAAGPDGEITCLAGTATLTGSASGGDGSLGYTFSWTPAAGLSDPAAASTTASLPGTYTLRATSVADGCVGIDTVTVADLAGPPETSAGPDRFLTCAASSVTLLGSASGSDGRSGHAFSWSPAALVSDPSSSTPTTSTPGTYTLTATDVFTGCSSSDTVVVGTDVAAPTAGAGPDATLTCAVTAVPLAGSASGGNGSLGYAFAWTPAAGLSDPASATPTASAPGVYTLTVTDVANGCTDTDVVVVAEDTAAPVADAGSDKELACGAPSVPLDGSASGGNGSLGYTFLWAPAAAVTDADAATTGATAAGSFTLTVTDVANGCTGTDTVVVTSAGGPSADAGPGDSITCADGSAALSGSASGGDGSLGYAASWSPAADVASPTSFVTTTTVPGTYTLTVTDVATGCRAFDTVVIADLRVAPAASAGAGGVVTCVSGPVPLAGSATGGDGSLGYEYRWEPAALVADPDAASTTTESPGTYTLTVTAVASGCTDEDTVVVADGRVPPVASAGADQSRTCAFPTATLAGSAGGGDGSLGYSFAWTPAAPLSDATAAAPTTSTAGTYTLTVTDLATGCTDVDAVTVSDDFAPPVAAAGPDKAIDCDDPIVTLEGSASGGNATLGYTFHWEPEDDVSNPATATPVALAPGTFTLTVTSNANGCTSTDTVVVADGTTPPTVSAGPDATIDCDTAVAALSGSASGGDPSGGRTFAWEPADDVADPTAASTTTTSPGIFSLTVTDLATGCSATDSVTVAQDLAVPTAKAGPDRRIDCDTPTATLSGSATGGTASLGYTHAWTPAADVADPGSAVTTTSKAGTYTLTVTAVANGCSDTDTVVVTEDVVAPTASAGADRVIDCDESVVTLDGSATGGNGTLGYGYHWEPAAAVSDASSATPVTSTAGTYTLTVTDLANGCTDTDTVTIGDDPATPTASAGPDLRLDCDTPLVTLLGSASGGDGSLGYAYHWEPAASVSNSEIPEPTTVTAGTYTLTVTSLANGCTDTDTITVTRDVRLPTASAGPDRLLDCDTPTVVLSGSATGGNASAGYAYAWSPAAAVSDPGAAAPTTSTPGTYTLTATCIATGCSDVDSVIVAQDVAAPVAEAGPNRRIDCATTVVTLDGSAAGGNGSLGYAYAWSPAAAVSDPAAPTPTTSTAGTYTLLVTDVANGCTATDTVLVTEDVAVPTASAGSDKVLDCSAASVTLDGSASGGSGAMGYSFQWEPAGGVTDASAAVTGAIASGTFTLTVTDLANGCTDTDEVIVGSSLAPPVASAGPDGSITCSDDTADLSGSASGGDGSLGYVTTWSPAAGVADPGAAVTTTTVATTYTLLVEDVASGCSAVDSVVIEDDTDAPLVAAGPDGTLTCASPTATLAGSATGGNGTGGYTFSWSPAGDVADPGAAVTTTTKAGTYTLTAIDAVSGCSAADVVVVDVDRAAPVADAGPDRPLGCTGVATLAGAASGGNGSAGYAFSWSPAAGLSDPTSATPTASLAGTYTLTVTDLANGCTAADAMIVAPDTTPPVASAGADRLVTCATPDVTLSGSASGGNGSDGYAFSWEPASDVSDPAAAAPTTSIPGTYTLTVTDLANACADTDEVVVTIDQRAPTANAGPDAELGCAEPSVPISGTAFGGNGSSGYAFHWEPAGAVLDPEAASTSATASGTFTLTVTDLANGCTDTDVLVVASSEPPPIANAGPDRSVRCDGPAQLLGSASGGDGRLGYSASWSPASDVADPTSFVTTTSIAGTYTLTVTDIFTGCRGADTVVVSGNLTPPVADAGPDDTITCSDGTASLSGSASGGIGSLGYQFRWEPAASVADPDAAATTTLTPGTYTLTVTDRANGCTGTDTVIVDLVQVAPVASAGPDQLLTCVVSEVTLSGSGSGGDGSQGYSYLWTPSALVSDPFAAVTTTTQMGIFTLTVTDVASGCVSSDTVTVQRDRRIPTADAGPNGFIDCAAPVASLRGSARGGNGSLGYSFAWSPTAGVADPDAATTTTVVPGTYVLTVTDLANGCVDTDTVTITDGGAPPFVDAGPDRIIGCGATETTLEGTATGGNPSLGYTWRWSPAGPLSDATIPTPTTSTAGTYSLTVTSIATGCSSSDTVKVTIDATPPVADAGPDATITCTQPLAPITGSASGGNGTAGYAFAWSPASSVVDPAAPATAATAPGTLTLTVTDLANGCTSTDTVVVDRDASLPVADAGADQEVSCATPTATLTGSASGGDGSLGYSYSWSPASEVTDPASRVTTTGTPGTYTLTITDVATGCLAVDTVSVGTGSVPSPPEPSALDLRPTAVPLRVRWTDTTRSQLLVTWEDVGAAEDRLHAGTIAGLHATGYDHGSLACGLAVSQAVVVPPSGSSYFIAVAASCDGAESSYGRRSFGPVERPDAATASGLPCP